MGIQAFTLTQHTNRLREDSHPLQLNLKHKPFLMLKFNTMRNFALTLVMAMLSCATILAQNVNVTATGGTLAATYTTLKGAFDAVNGGMHTGVITMDIALSTTEGTTPATLNSSGAGSASYTSILIRPSADGVSVSGNPITGFGVVQLKGADNVTIDGDNPNTAGTNRNLTINNTTTTTVIANSCIRIATATTVVTSADNITIRNCNLNGNVTAGNASGITNSSSSSNSSFGIYCGGNGGSTATDAPTAITSVTSQTAPSGTTINSLVIDNNAINQCARAIVFNGAAASVSTGVSITNNLIGGSGSLSGAPPYTSPTTTVYTKGIYVNGTTALTINGNTIQNILSYVATTMSAIELAGSIGASGGVITINNNTINGVVNNSSSGSGTFGILLSSATVAYTVSDNTISTIQNLASASNAGMSLSSSGPSGVVRNNRISGVYARSTGGYAARGILLSSGNNITVQNNMIWDLNAVNNNSTTSTTFAVKGIAISGGTGHIIYHNSVNLFGAMLGASTIADNTTCLMISGTGQTGIDIRNNIFSNTMTGAAATVHACLQLPSGGTSSMNLTLNNNAYYTGLAANSYVAILQSSFTGYTAANFNAALTTPATNLRAYTSTLSAAGTNDNASFASTTAAPFTSASDLHIPAATVTLLESGGAAVGVATDIDGDARPNGTAPDIGADEFVGVNPNACVGTPTAGTISSIPVAICASGPAVLSLAGATSGPGISYQWKEATAPGGPYTNVGTNSASYTTGTISANRYYIVDVTCSAGPTTVTTLEYALLVNPLPTVTVSPTSGLICAPGGTAVSLTASGASSYSWAPATGLNMTTGATVSANPTVTTTYTVTGTDGNGCVNTAMVTITVAEKPSAITLTPSSPTICAGGVQLVTAAGGAANGIIGSGTGFVGATSQPTAFCNRFDEYIGQQIYTAAELSAAGYVAGNLNSISFNVSSLGDGASNNNYEISIGHVGSTSTFPSTSFLSTAGFTSVYGPVNHTHTASGWQDIIFSTPFVWNGIDNICIDMKHDGLDLINNAQTQFTTMSGNSTLTFVSSTPGATSTTGTLSTSRLNIRFTPVSSSPMVWSPTTGLFTDAGATIAYTGTATSSVYASPSATQAYTVTATNGAGCTSSAMVTVNVNPLPTATVSGGGTVCAGDPLPDVSFALTGTGPWNLTYNDGTSNIPVMGIATSPYTITTAPVGTYTVVSVSDFNCTGTGSGSVTVAVTTATTWYQDSDTDTYGNPSVTLTACTQPPGYVADNTDCDDTNGAINPTTVWFLDADNDSYYTGSGITQCVSPGAGYKFMGLLGGNDCADGNPAVNPGATEVCDEIDNDCEGGIDEGVQTTFYADGDGDGFGNPLSTAMACTAPPGYVADNTDCDDTEAAKYPGNPEICDGLDNDCNGMTDEGVLTTFYADGDGDGFGDPDAPLQACTAPMGYVANNTDCDDEDDEAFPGNPEVCDDKDNDCDLGIDEGVQLTFYEDTDNDGFGDPNSFTMGCTAPPGYVANDDDCDDTNIAINPNATEICADGIDNDCDTEIDENCGPCPATGTIWYVDAAAAPAGNGASWACAFQQIQTAINAAANGDQILVASGLYVENLFVNKSLTISGAGRDLTIVNPATAAYTLHVDGNAGAPVLGGDVTIEGFTFADPQRLHWSIVATDHIASGLQLTFRNNRVTDGNRYGFWDYHSHGTLLCENNIFSNVYYGMLLEGWDTDPVTIQNNEFTNLHFYIDQLGVVTPSFGGPVGILSMTYSSDGGVDCTNAYQILENHFHTYFNDGFGIVFNGGLTGLGSAKYTDVEIARNTIAPGATGTGIRLRNLPAPNNSPNGGVHNADIHNNFIANVQYGIRLQGENPGTQAHDNSLVNCSTRALENTGTAQMGASCNWYGVSGAAAVAALVSGNVDFQPWLVNGTDDNLVTPGFQPVAGSCTGCAQPVLQTTINTVVVSNTNDGIDETGSFSVCDGEDVVFDNFQDISGLGLSGLKVYQTATYTNLTPTFCNNCAALLSTYTGMSETASLVNPALSGTLVLRFRAWADENGNDMVDPEECAADWIQYTITVLPAQIWYVDADGDGYGAGVGQPFCQNPGPGYATQAGDCNDNSALEKPGQVWYKDTDGDNYAETGAATITQCLRPVGYKAAVELTALTGDCNDNNAAINPAATEICDGVDNNCNGSTDEGVLTTYYQDLDGDTFGNLAVTQQACSQPVGYVANSTDCNDNSALEKPGQVWYKDTDGDNYAETGAATITACLRPVGYKAAVELTAITGDCNDNAAAINPAATEICDGVDNNCNGSTDEGVLTTYYQDLDGDTFGNPAATQQACSQPVGYVANNADCNDNSALEKPGQVWYKDTDGDNYAETGAATITACLRPVGYKAAVELTSTTGDCNDNAAAINPAATEICDGVDNNCDGSIDNGVLITYYRDMDGDGFGNPSLTQEACSPPVGYVANSTDCNDANPLEKPGQVWYKDTDNDGYAETGASTITQCLRPVGYKAAVELASITGDCNDNDAAIKPGVTEVCDGVDNNCNGSTDEGVQTTYYQDFDGDTFGNPAVTQQACSQPVGYVANNADCNDNSALEKPGQVWYKDTDNDGYAQTGAATITQCLRPVGYKLAGELTSTTGDCNDNNASVNPAATEVCNGIDDDCDAQVDETGQAATFYADADGDGFGNPAVSLQACTPPMGYVANNTDCNDNNPAINPAAAEICDGIDNNCNGQVDEPRPIGSPWSNSDVGMGVNGSASNSCSGGSNVINISASGFSTSSSDKLHLVYQTLCGNGEITARVLNVQSGGWAGVTLRESLMPGSKKVALKTQLSSVIRREIRSATNGAASILNFNRPTHVWLRLVRNGGNFTGYTSHDGVNWDFAFTATVSMGGCIYAGLFAESINTNVETNVSFDNVSITGTQNLAGGTSSTPALDGLRVSVYPNPGNGEMTLSVAGAPERNLQLEVTDMMGRIVRNIKLPEGAVFTYPLDLSNEPAGVYFLRLRSEIGVESVQRVVVQQ